MIIFTTKSAIRCMVIEYIDAETATIVNNITSRHIFFAWPIKMGYYVSSFNYFRGIIH